nr:hypothetical protein B11C_100049 [Bartonella sp. 1-1C]
MKKLERILSREEGYVKDLDDTLITKKLHDIRSDLRNYIHNIGKTGNLLSLLDIELSIVRSDLLRYSNSKAMSNSLNSIN